MWAYAKRMLLVCVAVAFVLLIYAGLTYKAIYGQYRYVIDDATPPAVSAAAWGVFDLETGETLASHSMDTVYPVASITKLMTAYTVLRDTDASATATVSWRAVAAEGRAGRLAAGDRMPLRELLFPLLLESSNDAGAAIAEHIGYDELIFSMNAHAREIGMPDTVFADPSGLSADNVSTVKDLALFMRHLRRAEPHVLDVTRLQKYIGESHTWHNGNLAAGEKGFLGGKNGYTDEAGRTLAAFFEQPLKNGASRTVGIVILKSENVFADLAALRDYLRTSVSYEYVI